MLFLSLFFSVCVCVCSKIEQKESINLFPWHRKYFNIFQMSSPFIRFVVFICFGIFNFSVIFVEFKYYDIWCHHIFLAMPFKYAILFSFPMRSCRAFSFFPSIDLFPFHVDAIKCTGQFGVRTSFTKNEFNVLSAQFIHLSGDNEICKNPTNIPYRPNTITSECVHIFIARCKFCISKYDRDFEEQQNFFFQNGQRSSKCKCYLMGKFNWRNAKHISINSVMAEQRLTSINIRLTLDTLRLTYFTISFNGLHSHSIYLKYIHVILMNALVAKLRVLTTQMHKMAQETTI